MTALITCTQLVQIYRVGSNEVAALQGLDLVVEPGEMLGVVGTSGSGKSTLLSVLSGLLRPTGGSVIFDQLDLGSATRRQLDAYRRNHVGFVWQDSSRNVLPYLSALDNVALPLRSAGEPQAKDSALELLRQVGLESRSTHRPHALSGGEQARVALAVALAHRPSVLLADEPTGELDSATTQEIFDLMRTVASNTGLTQIIVSHDPEVARHVDRVVSLRDGRVAGEQRMSVSSSGDVQLVDAVMVDSIGRLQLTEEQLQALGGSGRVQTELVGDVLEIRGVDD